MNLDFIKDYFYEKFNETGLFSVYLVLLVLALGSFFSTFQGMELFFGDSHSFKIKGIMISGDSLALYFAVAFQSIFLVCSIFSEKIKDKGLYFKGLLFIAYLFVFFVSVCTSYVGWYKELGSSVNTYNSDVESVRSAEKYIANRRAATTAALSQINSAIDDLDRLYETELGRGGGSADVPLTSSYLQGLAARKVFQLRATTAGGPGRVSSYIDNFKKQLVKDRIDIENDYVDVINKQEKELKQNQTVGQAKEVTQLLDTGLDWGKIKKILELSEVNHNFIPSPEIVDTNLKTTKDTERRVEFMEAFAPLVVQRTAPSMVSFSLAFLWDIAIFIFGQLGQSLRKKQGLDEDSLRRSRSTVEDIFIPVMHSDKPFKEPLKEVLDAFHATKKDTFVLPVRIFKQLSLWAQDLVKELLQAELLVRADRRSYEASREDFRALDMFYRDNFNSSEK